MQWLTDKQWLTDNAVWLGSAGALATIAALVLMLWKPLRSIASFCWSRIIPVHKPRPTLPVTDLRFVTILEQCRCSVGKVAQEVGEDEFTQIHARWYVTNASEPKMPVQLLRARILEPPIGGPVFCQINVEKPVRTRRDLFGPERKGIQPGETCEMSIDFIHDMEIVDIQFWPQGKALRVEFAVTDQLAREYRLPPLRFRLWRYINDKDVATAPTAE